MLTQTDVIYMILTDRFSDGDASNNQDVDRGDPSKRHGGDLLGVIRRMPYLQDLGVTALWITPVYVNPPDSYHGYHPLDFEAVDSHLWSRSLGDCGSREAVRRFVDEAHDHGLKVMLDLILCHTAPGHPWLKEHCAWFNAQGGSEIEKWWIWGLPDINHDVLDVNMYFANHVITWIRDTGVDAVRIDAARHVEKHFWPVFKLFTKGVCPEVTTVAEVWDSRPEVVAPFQTEFGFDSAFDYPLYEAIIDTFARGGSFTRLARAELSDGEPRGILNRDGAYRNAFHLITFLGNHDNPRFLHLAGGERRRAEAWQRLKLALTFLLTTRGIPQLYYGDELGMDGGADPDNRRDMPWELIDGDGGSLARESREFTKTLITLRRGSHALCHGLLTTLFVTENLYAYARTFFDDWRIVVLNNADSESETVIPIHANPRLPSSVRARWADGQVLADALRVAQPVSVSGGAIRVRLPPRSGAVFAPLES